MPSGMGKKGTISCLKRIGWPFPFVFQSFKSKRRAIADPPFAYLTHDHLSFFSVVGAGLAFLLTLPSGGLVSVFLTSGEVLVFGEVTGEPDEAGLGLVAGVVAGVDVTDGLLGAS